MAKPDASKKGKQPPSSILTKLGRRLKALRAVADLTQAELADAIGMGSDGISQIERGVNFTSMTHAEAIARKLKVPLHELFRIDPAEEHLPEVKRLIELMADQPLEIRKAIVEQAEFLIKFSRG